jgi:hypothetical protein
MTFDTFKLQARLSVHFLYICCGEDAYDTIQFPKPPAICLFVMNLDNITCNYIIL